MPTLSTEFDAVLYDVGEGVFAISPLPAGVELDCRLMDPEAVDEADDAWIDCGGALCDGGWRIVGTRGFVPAVGVRFEASITQNAVSNSGCPVFRRAGWVRAIPCMWCGGVGGSSRIVVVWAAGTGLLEGHELGLVSTRMVCRLLLTVGMFSAD